MMITRTLKTDNATNRLRSGGFDENLRFIHILELLKPNQDVELSQMTRMLSDISGSSVGTFNKLVSEEKPSKMTLEHIKKIKKVIPFLDSNYIMYENDPITGQAINPFIRELTEEDKDKFKPKKTKAHKGIDRDRCYRIKSIRLQLDDTQGSFADKLGVERYVVSSIEGARQNPTLDFIVLLKDKCKVDPWWVISGEGTMKLDYDKGSQSELYRLRERCEELERNNSSLQKMISKLIDL
jgi:transcriptional regulator with XRE-family HTH domain